MILLQRFFHFFSLCFSSLSYLSFSFSHSHIFFGATEWALGCWWGGSRGSVGKPHRFNYSFPLADNRIFSLASHVRCVSCVGCNFLLICMSISFAQILFLFRHCAVFLLFCSLSLFLSLSRCFYHFYFQFFRMFFFWPSLHINFSSVVIKNCFWGCCVSYSKLVPFTFFSSSLLLLLLLLIALLLLLLLNPQVLWWVSFWFLGFFDVYPSLSPPSPFGRCQRLLIVNEEKGRESN